MPVDSIVGLQYGSEGKGKISAHLADEYNACVRVGAWQAGHTLTYKGKHYKMQTIPCQWTNPNIIIVIGAGGMIRADILEKEIKMIEEAGITDIRSRLFIDSRVTVGEHRHAEAESQKGMFQKIGSTQEGIGACTVEKIQRQGKVRKAHEVPELKQFAKICDTIPIINAHAMSGKVCIEGTQGCHLSLTTSHHYPKCTSRDCNVSGFFSDCGISPKLAGDIWGVMRVYPIRVAGNSGDTGADEIDWDIVCERSGLDSVNERTTVTNRVRRVFEFSKTDIWEALNINQPNKFALMFADYLFKGNIGATSYSELSPESQQWIEDVEDHFGIKFDLISTGKSPQAMIDRRNQE